MERYTMIKCPRMYCGGKLYARSESGHIILHCGHCARDFDVNLVEIKPKLGTKPDKKEAW